MKRVLVLLSISLMLFSCATVTPPKGAADGSAALEVMEIWSEAVRTEDLDLFVSTYWEDAVREILPFGGDSAVIRGQAAIAENQMGYFERFDLSGFRLPEDREIRMEDGRVPILRYMYEGGRVEEFRFESRDGQWKIINQIIIMAAPPMVVAPIHELYDANGNGRLEPGELERLLPDFRAAVSEPHEVGTPLDEFFDLNGNGVLEPAEIESIRNYFFVEQLRRIYRYDHDFGQLLDADGDGHIALWEVETVSIMFFRDPRWREPRGVEHPLDIRIDRNEDGELDEEEIRGFMERLFLRIVLLPMDMPYDARRFGTFEEIRDWADLDGDGEIDGREFRDIVFVVGTLFHGAERGAVNPVYGYFDRNKDGMLDHIEIDRARGFFFRTALSQEIETDGMDLVQALDFDRSGGVDDREIELLAEFLFLRPESESVRVETPVDRLADKNGDGNVSGEERERFENLVFARIAAAWSRSPRKNMDAWDVRTVLDELADLNGDGIVDVMENELLVVGLAGTHRAESPFDKRLDVNGNGMVDDFEIVRARRAGLPGGIIDAAKDLPRKAYDAERDQYDARIALAELSPRVIISPEMERVLFVADVDLFVPGRDFVPGFADAERGTCIISLFRLRSEFYGGKPDNRSLTDRAVKEAVRELAATWGLRQCSNERCAVFYSDDIRKNDKKRETLCLDCRIKLNKRYSGSLMGPVLKK